MYIVVDDRSSVIAYHERKDVVKKYVNNVYKYNKIWLRCKKVNKKDITAISSKYSELYLIPYNRTYVQSGFLEYLELADDRLIEDTQYAVDVICRTMELCNDLSNRELKILRKATQVLENIIEDEGRYTPSYDDLVNIKAMYDPYLYNYKMPL